MSGKVVLAGSTSGTITLQAPAVAGNTIITLPATSGTLGLESGGIQSVASRPESPSNGTIIWNTSTNILEVYVGTGWTTLASQTYNVEFLIVAGGGGGGSHSGGGGGAGGLIYYGAESPKTPNGSSQTLTPGTLFTITIGAGGAGHVPSYPSPLGGSGSNGQNTTAFGVTAIGGGGGGYFNTNGSAGGSGGGGSRAVLGGSGTSGQGNAGGNGVGNENADYAGAGGGGAGASGGNALQSTGGNGGVGLQYSISGSPTYYAGGGGGNIQTGGGAAGTGGLGGGGAGAAQSGVGYNGESNTGGGGGGSQYNGSPSAGRNANGGSGVVIIRYSGNQKGTGGTVTSSGGYTIHTFTSSGTFTA